MSMDMNAHELRAAASRFLASSDLEFTSWEPRSQARTLDLLQQLRAGMLDVSQLRAAFGNGSSPPARPAPPPKTIAVIPLRGVLTPSDSFFVWFGLGTALDTFRAQLAAALHDPAIASIVIDTDSPGGSVRGVSETAA